MKTCEDAPSSRCRRRSARISSPCIGLARKIGIILHRMWIDGATYRWAEAKPIAAQA